MLGSSWVAAQLVASQDGLGFMSEWFSLLWQLCYFNSSYPKHREIISYIKELILRFNRPSIYKFLKRLFSVPLPKGNCSKQPMSVSCCSCRNFPPIGIQVSIIYFKCMWSYTFIPCRPLPTLQGLYYILWNSQLMLWKEKLMLLTELCTSICLQLITECLFLNSLFRYVICTGNLLSNNYIII
jgi:hypothetical protein